MSRGKTDRLPDSSGLVGLDPARRRKEKLTKSAHPLVQQYQEDCKLRGIRNEAYVIYARLFCDFCSERKVDPIFVEKKDLKAYLLQLQQNGTKHTTLMRIFASLSSFYAFLEDDEQIEQSPIPAFRRRYIRSYKEKVCTERRQLISVEQASTLVNSILDTRDKAMLVLLFKTGMRRGELEALDLQDLDMEKMEIRLKPTAKRSNLLLFFDYEAEEVLRAWLRSRSDRNRKNIDALFPSKWGTRTSGRDIEKIVKKHAERVGLHKKDGRLEERFSPHCCRHWFTTHLLRSGMRRDHVQWLRGDAIREAIDVYYHIDEEEVRKEYLAHIPQLGV